MRSLKEQLEEIKKVLNVPEKVGKAPTDKSKKMGVKGKKRRICKLCGVLVKVDRFPEHDRKFHQFRVKPKHQGGKLTLKESTYTKNFGATSAEKKVEDESLSCKSLAKSSDTHQGLITKTNKLRRRPKLSQKFEIEAFEAISVSNEEVGLINMFYKFVKTGNIRYLKDLDDLENISNLKKLGAPLRKYFLLNLGKIDATRLTSEQKTLLKKTRNYWSDLRDKRAIFSFLMDIGQEKLAEVNDIPKTSNQKQIIKKSNNKLKSAKNFKKIGSRVARDSQASISHGSNKDSSLIQNPEIRAYIKRVPDQEGLGKFGVPQDNYRYGFYGANSMEYDVWRKGEK